MNKIASLCCTLIVLVSIELQAQDDFIPSTAKELEPRVLQEAETWSGVPTRVSAVAFVNKEIKVGLFSPFTPTFDITTGKATAWVFKVYYKDFGNNPVTVTYIAAKVPGNQRSLEYRDKLDFPSNVHWDSTKQIPFAWMDSDNIPTALNANSTYTTWAAAYPNSTIDIAPLVSLNTGIENITGGSPAAGFATGDPVWLIRFKSTGPGLICGINAMNNATICLELITSVEEGNEATPLAIYPNPASNAVLVDVSAATSNGTVEIVNQTGTIVYSVQFLAGQQTAVLPVHAMSNGAYILRLVTSTGTLFQKIVVTK